MSRYVEFSYRYFRFGSGVEAEYIDTCSVSDAYAGWI